MHVFPALFPVMMQMFVPLTPVMKTVTAVFLRDVPPQAQQILAALIPSV
jgi:hypothetical protein